MAFVEVDKFFPSANPPFAFIRLFFLRSIFFLLPVGSFAQQLEHERTLGENLAAGILLGDPPPNKWSYYCLCSTTTSTVARITLGCVNPLLGSREGPALNVHRLLDPTL